MSHFTHALGQPRPGPQTAQTKQRDEHLKSWVKTGYRTNGVDQRSNQSKSPAKPRPNRGDDD